MPFFTGNEVETIAADESLPTYNGYVLVAIMCEFSLHLALPQQLINLLYFIKFTCNV